MVQVQCQDAAARQRHQGAVGVGSDAQGPL